MLNQKGFAPLIIILGLVLVLGLIAGAYYLGKGGTQQTTNTTSVPAYSSQPSTNLPSSNAISQATPTSDPTSNWKTFTNTVYFYTLKYPQNYLPLTVRLLANSDGTEASLDIGPSPDLPGAPGLPFFYVNVMPISGDSSKLTYNNDGFEQNLSTYLSTPVGQSFSPPKQHWNATFTRLH